MGKISALIILFMYSCLCTAYSQNAGCPDPAANNYDSSITINDGSCSYNNVALPSLRKYNLNTMLNESSGLLWWNNQVWSHNDSGGEPSIYAMDISSNTIQRIVNVINATNVDWEDIAQD